MPHNAIVNRTGKVYAAPLKYSDESAQERVLQKRVRVLLNQEIPELYEAVTSSQILSLQRDITQFISDSLLECVSKELKDCRLTEASDSAKIGWFAAETLLKVGLNMVSQSAGGTILDALHTALDTRGASPFELDKQMKVVEFADGTQGKVQTHRTARIKGSDINLESFTRQVLSDFGDLTYEQTEALLQDSALSQFQHKLSGLFQHYDKSRHGVAMRVGEHQSAIQRMLMPIEILRLRIQVVEQLINAVIFDELAKVRCEVQCFPEEPPTYAQLKEAVGNIKSRLHRLNIHGYITHLNDLVSHTLPRYSKQRLFSVMMAETLVDNAQTVLSSNQKLSKGLWQFLYDKQLIALKKEKDIHQSLMPKNAHIMHLKMKSRYERVKKEKLHKQISHAVNQRKLATSSNEKFGHTSSLSCLVGAELLLDSNVEAEKALIQQVHQESSYRRYVSLLDLSRADREFLEQKQATGEVALSIAIDKAFYA
ncbi:hypothetical protein [uncultured Shewanella sp.]|uniref:hypothetical protein n=1 Tax=uncultured Shewanella sp. TaxID=173975 RepID=UPI00262CA203|nr:hypothetical protein [uncultured Shewanella sp.]